jgi:outer membrane protein TolC
VFALLLPGATAHAQDQDPTQPPAPTLDGQPVEAPRRVTAGTVTLDEAVKRALARNPTVQIATEEIAHAEAIAKQVRATWWPTLAANGSYTRLDKDRVSNGVVISDRSQLGANLTLTIPIVDAKQWVAHARSKDAIELARISNNDSRRLVGIASARAYLTIIASKRVLIAAQRALLTAKAHEDFSQTRFKGGVGNRLDAVRASTERATAEVQVKRDLAALEQSQEALGVLLGEEGSVRISLHHQLSMPRLAKPRLVEQTSLSNAST